MIIRNRLKAGAAPGLAACPDSGVVIAAFTAAWKRGEAPLAEDYLGRLAPSDSGAAAELIYREFCLAEADGRKPEIDRYLARFPEHAPALERIMGLHAQCSTSLLKRWMETTPSLDVLPSAGDSIGPFLLKRELGNGGFARVFLAEQTNLENRLVVLKVSTRMSREPWLLARVRHVHIVEIVSHAAVDDGAFHLICMPFWGGATLAAVLGECRTHRHRPGTGNDLLAALDAVAAPEFPSAHTPRPTRDILAGLSYNQAVAWIIARLAEALDYAFSRDVTHGDVKPSNILLSADANPLLLDFNLARDGSPAGLSDTVGDPGGTLAYMAPERLGRAIANPAYGDHSGSSKEIARLAVEGRSSVEPELMATVAETRDHDGPHRADIYSLGMVMLEALTGCAAGPVNTSDARCAASNAARKGARSRRTGEVVKRSGGANALLGVAEAQGWGAIAPGLRAILLRCLDPDPARRYDRGLQLAEDLDRWRCDRPLVYVAEPFWGQIVPRLLRRQRRAILTAAASLAVIAVTGIALFYSHQTVQAISQHKLGRIWDDPEARAVRFQRPNAPQLLQLDSSRVETALRALKEYDVLESSDWRRRDDVRTLPRAEHDDLEIWLMEQAYRYCHALEDRPNSQNDWRRALKILAHAGGSAPIPAFDALEHRLKAKLGLERAISPSSPTRGNDLQEACWVNEYVLGVVAECESAACGQSEAGAPFERVAGKSAGKSQVIDEARQTRLAAQRALDHYHRFLEIRPDSFWGHYRAASVAYGLGGNAFIALAAAHLERCLEIRPDNPTLHHHRATCLMALDQNQEAQREVETAIERAPDVAEFYRTRATIRANLRQTGGLADDVRHFELLAHLLHRSFWDRGPTDSEPASAVSSESATPFRGSFALESRLGDSTSEWGRDEKIGTADPGEFDARVGLATAIRQAGELDLAQAEFNKLLILEPDHIGVRMTRAAQAIEAGRLDQALPDIEAILRHSGLASYLRAEPSMFVRMRDPNHRTLLELFNDASRKYCFTGKLEIGRAIARRAVDLAIELDQPRGMSHYTLARAFADSASISRSYIVEAADQLYCAFVAHPLYQEKYAHDATFDGVRPAIDAALSRKNDPRVEYDRRLAGTSPARGR